jgi:hypothetical protein
MSTICDECMHMVFENGICRCTEGKVIGCMYIGLVEGCTYYDISTNKRCKKRVIETENGKLFMCIEHGSKKKVHIKTTETKSKKTTSKKTSDESKKSETETKKKEKSETQTEKKRAPRKKVTEPEKKEVKPVKRKIVKKINEE